MARLAATSHPRSSMPKSVRCDVLAISSSGGHWVELSRLFDAFDGLDVQYACTDPGRVADVRGERFHALPDANKRTPWRLVTCAVAVARLVIRVRPRVVVTTGAAPGLFAVVMGKLLGARAVWVDIFGLVDRMTLSGRLVAPIADVHLVQWPHLARPNGPHYRGSLL
jgi:UDP-N-acetylglucosamine:LPS N-acetylglucosamine transferase